MLARAAYPELQAHAAIHVRLTKHVEKFIQRMESGEKALSVHLLVFLRDWLSIHILREDRAYSAWLQSCSSR